MKILMISGLLLTCFMAEHALAQLFGTPTGSRSTQRGTTQAQSVADRFRREERSVDDFVGRRNTDLVGLPTNQSAVISSVAGLREEQRPSLNRPRVHRTAGLYPERLTLDPALSQPSTPAAQTERTLSPGLKAFMDARQLGLDSSSAGQSVGLSGEVASVHERQVAELVLMFEPGIDSVKNEVTLDPTLKRQKTGSSAPQSRQPRRGRSGSFR